MRKVANVSGNKEVKRLMLYECENGNYFFQYDTETDSTATSHCLQDTVEIIYDMAEESYGVKPHEWKKIHDPMEFCQYDRIEHVRVVGINTGHPQWNRLEKYVSGNWVPLIE